MRNVLIAVTMITGVVFAQAGTYTLDKAIEAAMGNNSQYLAAKQGVKSAEGKMDESFGGFLPKLSLTGSYTYISSVPAMSISIPTGPGTVLNKTIITGENDNWVFKAQLTQQLYDWGRMFDSYSLSGTVKDAADLDLAAAGSAVRFSVKQAFYMLIFAKKTLAVSEESLHVAQQHLTDAGQKYKEGASSSFEVLRSRVQVSNLKPAVSRARNNVELAKLNLKVALGVSLSDDLDVEGELAEAETVVPEFKSLIEKSLSARPELLAARKRKEAARQALNIASTFDKPSLSGFASYNYQNPYYTQLSWTDSWNAGLNLSIPLFDGNVTGAKVKQAEADLASAELNIRRLEDSASVELKQLTLSLAEVLERIQAQKDAVNQAEEYHKISLVGFKSGAMTNLEVIDAELSLMNAKTGYFQALLDREITLAGIEKALGK